jgi:hypothetical protein
MNVAVPPVFVIDTVPVVVKPAMLCVVAAPAMVTPPEPDVALPLLLTKLPFNVSKKVDMAKVTPLLRVRVPVASIIVAAPSVVVPLPESVIISYVVPLTVCPAPL